MAEEQSDASTRGYRLKAAPENGTNVEEMELSGSEPRTGTERGLCSGWAGTVGEFWGRSPRRRLRQDLKEEQLQDWEAKFQGLVKAMESPMPGRGNTPQHKRSLSEDAKASLLPSKGTANTGQQPRGIKAAQASRGHCMDSEATDGGFKSESKPGGKKVKEEILDEEDPSLEAHRQRFRQLCYREAEGPREVCRSLRELCHQWLKPDKHTKEQILELIVLEQFLAILPPEVQTWLQGHNLETCSQAAALAEDFLLRHREAKRRKEKESFKKMVVNLPNEGATSSSVEIKQESAWDASSLAPEQNGEHSVVSEEDSPKAAAAPQAPWRKALEMMRSHVRWRKPTWKALEKWNLVEHWLNGKALIVPHGRELMRAHWGALL